MWSLAHLNIKLYLSMHVSIWNRNRKIVFKPKFEIRKFMPLVLENSV